MKNFAVIVEQVKTAEVSLLSQSKHMLSLVEKLDDASALKECKAQAAAIQEYLAHRRDKTVEEYNAAVKIAARVEHRLGQVLDKTVTAKGGRPKKTCTTPVQVSNGIPEQISRNQSSRAQQMAAVPWKKIEEQIDAKTQDNKRAAVGPIVKKLREEMGLPTAKKKTGWSISDDITKFRKLKDECEPRWTTAEDKAEMKQFFRQLANEVF